MYDDILLQMIADNLLRVCHQTCRVWYFHQQRKRWYEKKVDYHRDRARFKIDIQGRRVTVYRNRLVWLWTHRRKPEGVIDHADLDRTNDRSKNLQEMTRPESDVQGVDVRRRRALQEIGDWFESMARIEGVIP